MTAIPIYIGLVGLCNCLAYFFLLANKQDDARSAVMVAAVLSAVAVTRFIMADPQECQEMCQIVAKAQEVQ